MILLDSDHLIAILRGRLNLAAHLNRETELATSAINVAELIHGAMRSARREENLAAVDILFANLSVYPFDGAAARLFGLLKAELESVGQPLDDFDLQIASIARINGCSLATANTRHFQRIRGLSLVNWLAG